MLLTVGKIVAIDTSAKNSYFIDIDLFKTAYTIETGTKLKASAITIPGIDYKFKVGETVWVTFENNNVAFPIILSSVTVPNSTNTDININCKKLSLTNTCTLPVKTTTLMLDNKTYPVFNNAKTITLEKLISTLTNLQNNYNALNKLVDTAVKDLKELV